MRTDMQSAPWHALHICMLSCLILQMKTQKYLPLCNSIALMNRGTVSSVNLRVTLRFREAQIRELFRPISALWKWLPHELTHKLCKEIFGYCTTDWAYSRNPTKQWTVTVYQSWLKFYVELQKEEHLHGTSTQLNNPFQYHMKSFAAIKWC